MCEIKGSFNDFDPPFHQLICPGRIYPYARLYFPHRYVDVLRVGKLKVFHLIFGVRNVENITLNIHKHAQSNIVFL